jgi:hypothetical protein
VRRWWGEFVGTPPNETSRVVEVGDACCWLGCILLRVCSIACISWLWVVSSCSRLALLLLLLGWPLHWLFLVFTI